MCVCVWGGGELARAKELGNCVNIKNHWTECGKVEWLLPMVQAFMPASL